MTLFIDTADLVEIKKWISELGVCKGITTNQKIFAQTGDRAIPFTDYIGKLLEFKVPVSIELPNYSLKFSSPYFVVKVPMFKDGHGLRIAKELLEEGYAVNMTCLMDISQAILACELGVTYASFFYNRMVDYGEKLYGEKSKPMVWKHIDYTRRLIEQQGFKTKLICGSIRKPDDVYECLVAGAHIVTVTPKVLEQLPFHPKTEETIKEFDEAWKSWKGEQ